MLPLYKACDHAEHLSQPLITELMSRGYVASGRYTKSLTAQEVTLAKNNNYGIFIYHEGMGNAATFRQGHDRGVSDGLDAANVCRQLGVPSDIPISFAVDYGAGPSDIANILAYGAGFFYGSKYAPGIYCDGAVASMEPAGVKIILAGAMGWPGSRDFLNSGKAAMVQHPPLAEKILGVEIDEVDVYDASMIWWPGGKPNVRQIPSAAGIFWPTTITDLQIELREAGFDPGQIDGIRGPRTQAALLAWYNSLGGPDAE